MIDIALHIASTLLFVLGVYYAVDAYRIRREVRAVARIKRCVSQIAMRGENLDRLTQEFKDAMRVYEKVPQDAQLVILEELAQSPKITIAPIRREQDAEADEEHYEVTFGDDLVAATIRIPNTEKMRKIIALRQGNDCRAVEKEWYKMVEEMGKDDFQQPLVA